MAPGLLVEGAQVLDVRQHLSAGGVRVASAERRGDRTMVLVDRAVEARAELRAKRLGEVVGARPRHVAAARRAFRGLDQILCGEEAERLADRRPTDPVVRGEQRFGRQALTGDELTRYHQLAKQLGDALVR